MTVKDLKQAIATLPDDMQVILQKDSEGNGYSPLSGVYSDAVYIPETTWSGEVYDTKWTAEDACKTQADWRQILKMKRCLVLHPIN